MKKLTMQVLIALFAFTNLIYTQSEQLKPILIDEFGNLNSEENFVRLEFLSSELSKSANSKAVIRITGGSENCFLCHYNQGSYMTAILKSRILPFEKKSIKNKQPGKYSIEYCNGKEDLRVQLFLIPQNLTLPECNQILHIPTHSVLFQTVYFYSETQQIKPLENTRVETTSSADGEYSLEALKEVKKILDGDSESKIYIVVYLGMNLEHGYFDKKKGYIEKEIRRPDKKTLANKLVQNVSKEFAKNGIEPSQIKTIEGGYVEDKRKLEFWFVPKGGEIPKAKLQTFLD